MYQVRFYKGDYISRQRQANADGCVVYIEQHFNGGSATASYALANVATNAGRTSKAMAGTYVEKVCKAFGTKPANNDFATAGISVGGYKLRGNGNLIYTIMPAMLLEPMFASNPAQAAIIRSEDGQERLAECIVETILHFFPKGGLVAFSVGHKYRKSKPHDRGVALAGGGAEADYAERVLIRAREILEAVR